MTRDLLLGKARHAGTGDFHDLLSQLGWSMADFCRYAGVARSTPPRWRGHPLGVWPVELLRQRIQLERIEAWAKGKGIKMPDFSPTPLPTFPQGRYPRKRGDLKIDWRPLAKYSPWKR